MAKEICISSTPHETRLAILEDDQLAEIYYERENEYTLAGSIYNGRVTRVLPGMQSAFVDLGLERDAFLYVTDFLELEDPEESEEIERAATAGAAQGPREVRHGNGRGEGQREGQRPDRREPGRRGQDRAGQDRGREERRHEEPAPILGGEDRPAPLESSAPAKEAASEDEAGGARRWRGRRRRRGGRAHGEAPAAQGRGPDAEESETTEAPDFESDIHAGAAHSAHAESSRPPSAPSFVLPGESLSKYGGAPESASPASGTPAPPSRPKSSFKPSTLIEKPIQWDGSGLLPGESLSRHRNRAPEPEPVAAHNETADGAEAADAIEEQGLLEEREELAPHAANESEVRMATEGPHAGGHGAAENDDTAEEESYHPGLAPGFHREPEHVFVRLDFDDPDAHEIPEPLAAPEEEEAESASFEEQVQNREASHHVDPLPPSEFRLFGLGGKKKKSGDDGSDGPHAPEPVSTAVAPHSNPAEAEDSGRAALVSSFAPGAGLVEEEVIEGEEYDGPSHQAGHRGGDHDLDDFEEETLQTQIRSGELGEMLQEAHLDHRIQLEMGKNGEEEEDEETMDEEEAEEEEAAAARPAPSEGGGQRRERGHDGMRGRRGGRPDQGRRGRGAARRSAQTSDLPIISDLLKPGQEILVQIAKEPIAKKGARITSHIALPGRFLVFMPTVSHVGVSRKIASDEERHRLKRIL